MVSGQREALSGVKPALAIALTVGCLGCRHDGDENLGLARARPAAVDVGALAKTGELEKALAMPSTEIARAIGAHRFTATTKLDVSSGETRDSLEETFRLDVDARGWSHLVHEDSHGNGSEAIAAGGDYFVRPRWGRFVRRSPEGDEVERARDEMETVLAGYFQVLGRFASRALDGETTVAGRRALKVKLALAPTPAAFTDEDPAHAWRSSARVSALDGEVDVDAASGAPLAARLDARYSAKRGDRAIEVALAYRGSVEPGAPAVAAPADSIATERPRPLVERQQLLDGLATGKPIK